jgi:hypothetical protein
MLDSKNQIKKPDTRNFSARANHFFDIALPMAGGKISRDF